MDTVVIPEYRSQRVGSLLIEARQELIRQQNMRGLVAGSLIRDYAAVADQISAEDYVREVVAGLRFDSNLSKQLRKGFVVHGLIPNYTETESSRGWGVEIVWENPHYVPQRRVVPVAPVVPVVPQPSLRPAASAA